MNARPGGYVRPVNARISSSFAAHLRRNPPSVEPGTDYACAYGTTIYAAEDGVVSEVRNTTAGAPGRALGIRLDDGHLVRYIHLSKIDVTVGQRVKRGQAVARSGASAWGREWGVGAHVHVSLWPSHEMSWPRKTIDFDPLVGADNDVPEIAFQQVVADRQNFLNAARGEKLVVDGLNGRNTKAAIERYQAFLKSRGWYSGPIDGVWGNGTQAGHEKFFAEWSRPAAPAPATRPARVGDLASVKDVRGLQKIAKLYGYSGRIDNVWGPGSQAGLQRFLDQSYGGSLAAWLRAKWGYRDRDDIWGPNMAAAAARASAANLAAL